MIKGILTGFICLISSVTFACPAALPTNDVNFCASFETATFCYCTTSGYSRLICQDMNMIYNLMMVMGQGSLEKACKHFEKYSTLRDCVDNWTCYRFGGTDSRGRKCSNTQQACKKSVKRSRVMR
jgi:hypothetical protein